MAMFTGKQKITFCKRLNTDWPSLADYFEIAEETRNRFAKGDEAREIWAWLTAHEKLEELYDALEFLDRKDLVVAMRAAERDADHPTSQTSYRGNPYPGLRAFTEQEKAIFFGRKTEIDTLLKRFAETRFLAVIGPSGSGKSSLVRAGLIATLKSHPGGAQPDYVRFTPGALTQLTGDNDPDPFQALAAALGPKMETANLTPLEMAKQLKEKGNIAEIMQSYFDANPQNNELILFIDQFEELFSLVNEKNRQRFIAMLERADRCLNLRIVITVRADFLVQCLDHPALAKLINKGDWHLASPDQTALWQMITRPAAAAGIRFEDGLAEQMIQDTGTGAGALALMAFALSELYSTGKSHDLISFDAYERIGGVKQAIGRRAETIYQALDAEAQAALDSVFAELITVEPERGVATRRRASMEKLCTTPGGKQFVDAFTDARLFVTDSQSRDEAGRSTTNGAVLEVAHEALFSHWPLLQRWITDRFDDFCLLRQVRLEAAEWQRKGRPEANLWPHERLQTVDAMQQRLKPAFSQSELAFIRPEAERLLEKLTDPALTHQQRERSGVRLAEIGDPRPGVGVDEQGLPEIEWCPVPPGNIVLEDNAGTFDVTAFFISKYPVTYRQYRAFLEAADGYTDQRWWKGLEHNPEPGEQYRKADNHPAECVSWFEAMAFCRWLSEQRGYKVRLPTEWEWQQAATGGNPDNVYPWGNNFDTQRCNTYESGLGRSTAVGLYPNGTSPVGALDMSGNVWEWCANHYDEPKNTNFSSSDRRVVRGGSWGDDQHFARTAYRYFDPQCC